MKIVYIAHPIGGDVERNLADLRRIIKKINWLHIDVVPFAPYYADVVSMDDNDPADRGRGIKNNIAIINSGIVKEVWLTGNWISKGMEAEAYLAAELGIPVVDYINKL